MHESRCAMGTEPRAMDAAATRLLVNVAGLVAREIEAIAGPDYDLPLAPKVSARVCDISVTQVDLQCASFLAQHSLLHFESIRYKFLMLAEMVGTTDKEYIYDEIESDTEMRSEFSKFDALACMQACECCHARVAVTVTST